MALAKTYLTVNGKIRSEQRAGEAHSRDYVLDPLGSVIQIYQNGWPIADACYEPYGGIYTQWNMEGKTFTWLGGWGYRQTGVEWSSVYVRARHYSRGLSNWTTIDPLWPSEMAYGYVEGRVMTGVDYWGMKKQTKPSLGKRIAQCKKKKPRPSCFNCLYTLLHSQYNYSPEQACEDSNRICGTKIACGPCGPGSSGFPKAPNCSDVKGIRSFSHFLHGAAGKDACGGYQGHDKLAHCYVNCMASLCLGLNGVVACWLGEKFMNEDDPEDYDANQLGRKIGLQLDVWSGQDCFEKCADAVRGMSAW